MDEQVSQFLIVLNDEAKLKACAERYRKGSGVQPSLQSVVREATVFLMSVKKTESDLPGTFAPYLESMSALLAEGHCFIWDLFSFMEVEQITFFLSSLLSCSKPIGLSPNVLLRLQLELHLTTIWSEMLRVRKARFCLQNSDLPITNSHLNESLEYCISFVNDVSHIQLNKSLYEYTCLLLGYSAFYSMKWNEALKYWNRSNWKSHHWYEKEIPLLSEVVTHPSLPKEVAPHASSINWDSIPTRPTRSSKKDLVEHTCILNVTAPPPLPTLLSIIRSHLIQWNRKSSFFCNLDAIASDERGFVCVMMCLYRSDCVSEMICFNQFVAVCSPNDLAIMMCTHDFDPNLIEYLWNISILEQLIHLYSQRRVVSDKSKMIYTMLVKRMQNPMINCFNDPSILSSERRIIQKRLLQYLYLRFVSLST
ncbi:hypothetical protein WA588_005465 [Blastocystis sp. NMH]